jgi:hypothetical protein
LKADKARNRNTEKCVLCFSSWPEWAVDVEIQMALLCMGDKDGRCRSQWPRGLRHELSSPAPTLGSWVRIPLRHGCLCVFCVRIIWVETTNKKPNMNSLKLAEWAL